MSLASMFCGGEGISSSSGQNSQILYPTLLTIDQHYPTQSSVKIILTRNAPHESKTRRSFRTIDVVETTWHRDQGISNQEPAIIKKNKASGEMSSQLENMNSSLLSPDFKFFGLAFDKCASDTHAIKPVQPDFVLPTHVHGTIKFFGPDEVGRIVMGMRDHNCC